MGDMTDMAAGFTGWAVVEVLGHKRFAGFVSEQTIAGGALVRVDVPGVALFPRHPWDDATTVVRKAEFSKLIGVGSIYCITPCTEDLARRAAEELQRYEDPFPVSLPTERRLTAGETEDAQLVPAGEDDTEDDTEDDGKPF